jgi:hypothetical protein
MLWAVEIDVRCGPLSDEAAEDLAQALAQEDIQAPVVAEDLRAGTLGARFHVEAATDEEAWQAGKAALWHALRAAGLANHAGTGTVRRLVEQEREEAAAR